LYRPVLQGAISHYDDLFMVLAPYLHEARYTSYGRHFTMPHLLHAVANRWGAAALRGQRAGMVSRGAALEHSCPFLSDWYPPVPICRETNLFPHVPTHLCRLALFLSNGDQVVDFSCGENYFVPYLVKRCLR
jgi:hypothetical protein